MNLFRWFFFKVNFMLLGLIYTITNTSCKKQEKENKTFMYIYTIDIKKMILIVICDEVM